MIDDFLIGVIYGLLCGLTIGILLGSWIVRQDRKLGERSNG